MVSRIATLAVIALLGASMTTAVDHLGNVIVQTSDVGGYVLHHSVGLLTVESDMFESFSTDTTSDPFPDIWILNDNATGPFQCAGATQSMGMPMFMYSDACYYANCTYPGSVRPISCAPKFSTVYRTTTGSATECTA